MLDNLINPDLSGVGGYIRYTYDNTLSMVPLAIIAIAFTIFIIGMLVIFYRLVVGSKSKQYRSLLSDMYVVGKIKQIATKDKIDLISELKKFGKIIKKSNTNLRTIDEVIEMELKEKISDEDDSVEPTE